MVSKNMASTWAINLTLRIGGTFFQKAVLLSAKAESGHRLYRCNGVLAKRGIINANIAEAETKQILIESSSEQRVGDVLLSPA
jgi:hypothetical protein